MKKGFISMAVVYSFLIVFLVLMASFLASYINKNKFSNKLIDTSKTKLNEKYQDFLVNGDEPAPQPTYVYWNANTVVNTTFTPTTMPNNASNSMEELGVSNRGGFIRTTVENGTANGHEICISNNGKIACIKNNYWDTNAQTTLTKYRALLESSLQTTNITCTNSTTNISCGVNSAYMYIYNSGSATSVDPSTSIICDLSVDGKAKCWFD